MTTHKETVTSPETPAATATPRLEILAAQCGGGTCPTVYRTDRGTAVVQGYQVADGTTGIEVPDGERLVEIPVEVLLAAADQIRKQA